MNLASPQHVAASQLAGVSKLDHVDPIVASDEEIARAVVDADLPALLAALAVLTDNDSLIAEDLRPPPSKMGASIKPQGGPQPGGAGQSAGTYYPRSDRLPGPRIAASRSGGTIARTRDEFSRA
ncbi:MAG: hypothetical protein V4477_03625 [Pseudomonadota bacterium]